MRELVFALEFRGHGRADPDGTRRARTEAPSQGWRTVLGAGGVHAEHTPLEGERAVLESRVQRFDDGTFVEDGTITYGRAGRVTFETVGRGTVGPSPIAGRTMGAVIWTVVGGEGAFRGARGLITSSFTVSTDGEVIDAHVARLYLP
jgi:hypothetical protein